MVAGGGRWWREVVVGGGRWWSVGGGGGRWWVVVVVGGGEWLMVLVGRRRIPRGEREPLSSCNIVDISNLKFIRTKSTK